MQRLLRTCLCLAAFCGQALASSDPSADATASPSWWDPGWKYRLLISVPEPALRGGINTACFSMADQSALCLPDGLDVRVMTREGARVPHRVVTRENRTLDVLFEVPPDHSQFYLYYNNALAEKDEGKWREQLGGLTVEVRPLRGKLPVQAPRRGGGRGINRPEVMTQVVGQLTAEMARKRTPYGTKPWGKIHDLQNPFRTADNQAMDDMYLSIYEGTVFFPVDGRYTFAINADDAALFSMQRGGEFIPVCWRYGGEISRNWTDESHPDGDFTFRQVDEGAEQSKPAADRDPRSPVLRDELRAGVYRIRYLHVEHTGAQLAALGWRTPFTNTIETVPEDAFVHYLPVTVRGRENRDEPFSPFFDVEHAYNLKVNAVENLFPDYRFAFTGGWNEAPDLAAAGWHWTWDFGDGTEGTGQDVVHEFPALRSYEVTLTVRRPDGKWARTARTIAPPDSPVREMAVQMQLQSERLMLTGDEPLALRAFVSARNQGPRLFTVRVMDRRRKGDGEQQTLYSHDLLVKPVPAWAEKDRWESLDISHPLGGGQAHFEVEVALDGVAVLSEHVRSMSTADDLTGLHLDECQELRDAAGALVRLVLADPKTVRLPARKLVGEEGTVRVLVFDELLGGPPGLPVKSNYIGGIEELLSEDYPALKFEFTRSIAKGEVGSQPILKFLHIVDTMARARPHLVILVWPPQAIADGLPIAQFKRFLDASVDQLLAHTRAEVIVITSPPLPGHPELAFQYARSAKVMGLRRGVHVVDLYSRFLLTQDWRSLFRIQQGRFPSYLLYPTARGQEEIVREVYQTIREAFHERFSTAVRRIAMARAAHPSSAAGERP